MRKWSCLLAIIFLSGAVFAASPFITMERYESSLLDNLIRQEPVQVYITSSQAPAGTAPEAALIEYTQTAFSAWFENVLSLLEEGSAQEQALQPYIGIIRYGANFKNYHYTSDPSYADIKVHYIEDDDLIAKKCNGGAFGCYLLGSKTIWMLMPENIYPPYGDRRTIIHEIGHAFTMDDLYVSRYLKKKKVGSGLQDASMNRSRKLTCDDADAIVIALYKAKGANDAEIFALDSFCGGARKYENGKMAVKETRHEHTRGVRLVYTNCLGEPVKPQLEVSINDPRKMYKIIGKKECVADLIAPQAKFEEISSGPKKHDFAHLDQMDLSGEKVFHKPLLLSESGLDLFVHVRQSVPDLFYILDKKANVVYMSALLGNGYRWVYEYPFSTGAETGQERCLGGRCHGWSQMFVYKPHDPTQYAVFTDGERGAEKDLCYQQPSQCEAFQRMNLDAMQNLSDRTGLRLVMPEGGMQTNSAQALAQIQRWEKEIATDFPTALRREQVERFKESLADLKR